MVNFKDIDRFVDEKIEEIIEEGELGMEWTNENAKMPLIQFLSSLCLYRSSRHLETLTRILVVLTIALAILTIVQIFRTYM